MKPSIFVLAVTLTLFSTIANADVFSGVVQFKTKQIKTSDNDSRTQKIYYINSNSDRYIIGCGPSSELSNDMQNYLEKNLGNEVSLSGTCVRAKYICIDEPKFISPKTTDTIDLSQLDWLIFNKNITDDKRVVIQEVLTNNYYDPVFASPVATGLGICRYFHDNDFKVNVSCKFIKWAKPEQEEKGNHLVTVTFSRPKDNLAFRLQFDVIYNLPNSHAEINKKLNTANCKSIYNLNNSEQTNHYSRNNWQPLSSSDWLAIVGQIAKQEYIKEAR